jgi:hypothetical protein
MPNTHAGSGMTRREVLRRSLLGAAGLALGGRLGALAQAPAPRPPAKSVIQIWMWGGPSHLDTFDPKPEAGYDFCGPLKSPIPTNVDGLRICELLPLLAKKADKYAVLRGMTHGVNAHETASYIVQTGRQPGSGLVYPSVGAVVSLFRGYDGGYQGRIPPYVVLEESQGRFSEAGFLGLRYMPFATGGDPNQKRFAVDGIVAEGVSDERQKDRRELLHSLDTLGHAVPGAPEFAQLDRCEANAYELILGEGGKVFDLASETDEMRERYGRNTFGQSCLTARRLVEHGVPYVTINYKGWDTHKRHFETMRQKLPQMDQGMATLLTDLEERGLLDSTVIWWTGEFGRTPRIQWEEPWNGGRGHYGKCFDSLLAGGGFRGGRVVGASDATGENVAERPINPGDVIRAIYERMGIDADGPLPNGKGVTAPVLPEPEGGARLAEIL